MTTPKLSYIARRLEDKQGVMGKVAARYVKAGYSVELYHPTRYGPAEILAKGNKGELLVIEVISPGEKPSIAITESLLNKSKLLKAKPILAIYGDIELPEDVYKFCRENGIKIRRFKAERAV